MRMIREMVFALFLFLLHDQACGQKTELIRVFPRSSPEQQGISSLVLDSMMMFIKNTNQNIHHIAIIRNDRTVLEADIYPYSSAYLHDIASVTKSITSLLTGIAIDKGFIKDENEAVLHFFPEITHYDKRLDSLKIKHLVTMTSGFACTVDDGEKALSDMRKSSDWVKFIFALPLAAEPGKSFSYCSCNFYLLAEIIRRATKLSPHEFAKKTLFRPLGIASSVWLANDKNVNHGWGDLFLHPVDMARIGKLMLNRGRWENKQVISTQWIEKCLHTVNRLRDDKGYSYGWWTNDKVGYCEAAGRGRQTISVIPSENMIVTMLGGEFDAGTIGKYIFQSIKARGPLPESASAVASLNALVREIALPPTEKKIEMNGTIRKALDRRTILFEKNITGIDSMAFTMDQREGGLVTLYKNAHGEEHSFVTGAGRYALSMDPALHLPVAVQAICRDGNEFILHYNQLCRINNFYFHFVVNGDHITTTLEETSNFIKTDIASHIK